MVFNSDFCVHWVWKKLPTDFFLFGMILLYKDKHVLPSKRENFYKQFSLFLNKYFLPSKRTARNLLFLTFTCMYSRRVFLVSFLLRREVRLIEINNWKSFGKLAFSASNVSIWSGTNRILVAQIWHQKLFDFLEYWFLIRPVVCTAMPIDFDLRLGSLPTFHVKENRFSLFPSRFCLPELSYTLNDVLVSDVVTNKMLQNAKKESSGSPRGIKRISPFIGKFSLWHLLAKINGEFSFVIGQIFLYRTQKFRLS